MIEFKQISPLKCPFIEGKKIISESYSDYCHDESRLQYSIPDKVYFPENINQLSYALKSINEKDETVTISSARTGIVGGATNISSKNIISMDKMKDQSSIYFNKDSNKFCIKCSPGTTLSELRTTIRKYKTGNKKKLYFPVDPTEQSASIGGMVATDASGARSFFYGSTRKSVRSLSVMSSDGDIAKIIRGHEKISGTLLEVMFGNMKKSIDIPDLKRLNIKNTAGFFSEKNMDPIDIFIGSEGTLGVITEIELELAEISEYPLYCMIYLRDSLHTAEIADCIKRLKTARPIALEYLDNNSLKIINEYKLLFGENSIMNIPDFAKEIIYIEFSLDTKELFHALIKEMNDFIDISDSQAGFSTDIWIKMKEIRHCVPEMINMKISKLKSKIPEITKIGTDFSVPDDHIKSIINFYRSTLNKINLEHAIFGHLGNGHLHVNIIPKTKKELLLAKNIVAEFAEKVVSFNGSIAAEHGIGILKKQYMRLQYSNIQLRSMYEIKLFFDPKIILNPDVLIGD